MKLLGKKVLILAADGTSQTEIEASAVGFECDGAATFITSPHHYLTIETENAGKRGRDILTDVPIEGVVAEEYDALIIPDGKLSVEYIKHDERARELVWEFHQNSIPVFASGEAVEVLHETRVLSPAILVREASEHYDHFIERAGTIIYEGSRYKVE